VSLLRLLTPFTLAALAAASAACSPSSSEGRAKEPLGQMPSATTTAKPEWIPFRIRAGKPVAADTREKHLTEVRQLTFGGENAEAYWSPDGQKLILQSTRDSGQCDQIYVLDLGSGETKLVSTGKGKTTCSYFLYPKGEHILYASTHAAAPECPPKPDRSLGYAWPLDEMDIYAAKPDGSELKPLVTGKGYDAEATVAFDGSRMVFTSVRDGDLELYTSKLDGSDIRRITSTPGYDGGAFFSPDATKLVWRAGRPEGAELEEYRTLLAKGVVKPNRVEIIVSGAEGQNARFITKNGKANFGPSYLPDSRRVIFSSNVDSTAPRGAPPNFELYVIDPDGPVTAAGVPALERITYYDGFDGFPMFSPAGDYLVFASNRMGSQQGETNLFVAKWVE
jgi:Tol biopolymer transport system component